LGGHDDGMLPSPRRLPLLNRVPPRILHLARYASVSVIATLVGLSTLAVLVDIGHWSATGANVVATALGTIPSFELNRRWVWGRDGRRSLRREVVPFCGLCLLELVASSAAVHATAAWTQGEDWGRGVRTLADLAANVSTYGLLWMVQYAVLDRLLFARRSAPAPPRPVPPRVAADPRGGPPGPAGREIQPESRPSSSAPQELTSGCPR
jgi:putative flippase GtrA